LIADKSVPAGTPNSCGTVYLLSAERGSYSGETVGRVMRDGDDLDVLWVIAAAGPLGVLLGLRYKVSSLIAASGGIAVLIIALAFWAQWAIGPTALTLAGAVVTLQAGYLVGLAISGHRRPPRTD
jgi:hypothetical protein